MKKSIIWLASYPKSGNTWFRVFLSNLFSNSKDPVSINHLIKTPIASSRSVFDKYSSIDSSDLSIDEINLIRPKIYEQIAIENHDNTYIKVHDLWGLNIDNKPIFQSEITKGVIYIIRNPLDVSVSFAQHSNRSLESTIRNLNNEEYSLCEKPHKLHNQLNQRLSSWSKHVESWIDHSGLPIHLIRYEDMIEKPIETFTEAVNFLNLENNQEIINMAIEQSSFLILRKQEEEFGFKEKSAKSDYFFRKGKSGSWKEFLSRRQIESILSSNKTMMKRYGYYSDL